MLVMFFFLKICEKTNSFFLISIYIQIKKKLNKNCLVIKEKKKNESNELGAVEILKRKREK